ARCVAANDSLLRRIGGGGIRLLDRCIKRTRRELLLLDRRAGLLRRRGVLQFGLFRKGGCCIGSGRRGVRVGRDRTAFRRRGRRAASGGRILQRRGGVNTARDRSRAVGIGSIACSHTERHSDKGERYHGWLHKTSSSTPYRGASHCP